MFNKKKIPFNYKSETFNIVESISKAKPLFKELIVIAHPDKNPNKIEAATEITKLLNENRCNFAILLELRERINRELS